MYECADALMLGGVSAALNQGLQLEMRSAAVPLACKGP